MVVGKSVRNSFSGQFADESLKSFAFALVLCYFQSVIDEENSPSMVTAEKLTEKWQEIQRVKFFTTESQTL